MRFADVEWRLVEAMTVLMRSRDRERRWIGSARSSVWQMCVDDWDIAQRDDRPIVTCAFTRQQQDLAAEALEWVAAWVPAGDTRRVLSLGLQDRMYALDTRCRSVRIEWTWVWGQMGGKAGKWTTDALRMRYNRAITMICERLNARVYAE